MFGGDPPGFQIGIQAVQELLAVVHPALHAGALDALDPPLFDQAVHQPDRPANTDHVRARYGAFEHTQLREGAGDLAHQELFEVVHAYDHVPAAMHEGGEGVCSGGHGLNEICRNTDYHHRLPAVLHGGLADTLCK